MDDAGAAAIMIVEDEALVAMHLARKLKSWGFSVSSVHARGEDAILAAKARPPALVLMDIMLEGAMDGVSAAREILSAITLPVIFLTANSDPATNKLAMSLKPAAFINKPFVDEELKQSISRALSAPR